ncbi:glycosyltransferase family 2 protein [Microcoleus sp. FACHB-672]|uniref:glycosyltransferase family 2 protein n=1 Tax=Microcoleus sp. FACHB-672 TaxID=2692825 RepID=UPI002B27345E|nr:glycosyltransferase family 2 protein [Microcoleus sp. FACHB-672]
MVDSMQAKPETTKEDTTVMSDAIGSINPPLLLVVILNYRTPVLTIECLRSLVEEVQSLPGTHVVVVDGASGDGSAEQIAAAIENEGWSEWAELMPLEHNGGYAYGNNAALRPALEAPNPPPYFLLLNPDTVVRPNALKILVDFMEEHPDVGLAGSGLEDLEGNQRRRAFRFPTVLSELDSGLRLGVVSKLLSKWALITPMPEEPTQAEWVPGASMIVRREVFKSIGLMDEEYFLYYEETDFCLQAKRAGWPCWYVPQSRVAHIPGQSTGVTAVGSRKRIPKYWFDSRQRYFLKNHGWAYTALADLAWASGFILWRGRRVIQRKPDEDPPYLLNDFLRNSVLLKGFAKSTEG